MYLSIFLDIFGTAILTQEILGWRNFGKTVEVFCK